MKKLNADDFKVFFDGVEMKPFYQGSYTIEIKPKESDMPKLIFKDLAGVELKAEDYIIYATSLGRYPGLKYGKVLEIVYKKHTYGKDTIKLRVIGYEQYWKRLNAGSSLLEFEERVIKINEDQILKESKAALDNFVWKPKGEQNEL